MKAKKKIFKARNGSPFSVKDAQKIGEELESIKQKENLTPISVLKRAKDKKSILNQYFDWEDTIAAEKWRIQQARNIVNHVIEITVIRGEEIEQRAYFNVIASNDESIYTSLAEVIKTPSYRKQLLDEMKTILENLLRLMKLFSSLE